MIVQAEFRGSEECEICSNGLSFCVVIDLVMMEMTFQNFAVECGRLLLAFREFLQRRLEMAGRSDPGVYKMTHHPCCGSCRLSGSSHFTSTCSVRFRLLSHARFLFLFLRIAIN